MHKVEIPPRADVWMFFNECYLLFSFMRPDATSRYLGHSPMQSLEVDGGEGGGGRSVVVKMAKRKPRFLQARRMKRVS